MIYNLKGNANFNLTADDRDEAANSLKIINSGSFTLEKGDNTSGNWYRWYVTIAIDSFHKKRVAEVMGRSENEARAKTVRLFEGVTAEQLGPNGTETVEPTCSTPEPAPQTAPQVAVGSVPANTGFTKEIPKVKPKYIFLIGDSGKQHGFHVFEATSAREAWEIGVGEFKAQFPSESGIRLGLWQRVLVPVHASRMWASADLVKGLKTPSHFAVDVPVGLGTSDEKWSGPEDMINTVEGVVSSVAQQPITHVVTK
jgi:hypothetical protein